MKATLFRLVSILALLALLGLSACTAAAPSPTPTSEPPPTGPEPVENVPLADGSFTTTITKEDYQGLDIPEEQICEVTGTFTMTFLGNVIYSEQTPAPGCTVLDSWGYATWELVGKKGINIHDEFGAGCPEDTQYLWGYDGNELALTVGVDGCPVRERIMTSHPWVKQAAISAIPERFQNRNLWQEATDTTIGKTRGWTYMVELADLNKDGLVDLLFANGGMWNIPGTPELSQVFLNQGAGKMFKEVTEAVLGSTPTLADTIKVRDVNNDGNPDIMLGTTFLKQSRLYLGDGSGAFTEVTATHLPQIKASVGDMEFGDVDGDGDLDLALTDNGPGNLALNEGGRTMLWLNDGSGKFSDATAEQMPEIMVRLGGEIGLVDVDNDYDLDILIACTWVCDSIYLFENDGTGTFSDATSAKMPKLDYPVLSEGDGLVIKVTDYTFAAADLNQDGFFDLVTLNSDWLTKGRIFLNNQQGGFTDATQDLWPPAENIKGGGTNIAFLDYDSDGDADFLIGNSRNPGRLLVNDGSGKLTVLPKVFSGPSMAVGHFLAVSDLDGDKKLDVVMAQPSPDYDTAPFPERVFLAQNIEPDTAPPVISLVEQVSVPEAGQALQIRARIHDNKSPIMPQDWQSVVLKWTADGKTQEIPLQWYGEYLWRAVFEQAPAGAFSYQVCATDAAGNDACSEAVQVEAK